MDVKLKTARDKLENLTITIKNEAVKKRKKEKLDENQGQQQLLERLKSKHLNKKLILSSSWLL